MPHDEVENNAHYTSNIFGDVVGLVLRIGEFIVSVIITYAIHKVFGLSMGWYSFFILPAVVVGELFLIGGKLDDLLERMFPPVLKDSRIGRLNNLTYEWMAKIFVIGIFGALAWLVYLDFK